jgi:hypothetical protein
LPTNHKLSAAATSNGDFIEDCSIYRQLSQRRETGLSVRPDSLCFGEKTAHRSAPVNSQKRRNFSRALATHFFSRNRRPDVVSQPGQSHGTADHVVDNQNQDRPNHRDQNAIKIQTRYASRAEFGEKPAADYSADDAQENIQDQSFTRLVYEFASEKSSN